MRKFLLLICVTLFSVSSYSQNDIYVDSSKATAGDGTSWANAFKTLTDAFTKANANAGASNIYVAKGTYYPTGTQSATDRNATFLFPADKGVKIYGGYAAGGTSRNFKTNTTTLSGDIGTQNNNTDNSYHVVVMTNTATADSVVLDGLVITKGNANGAQFTYNGKLTNQSEGGGILFRENVGMGSRVAVRNCAITDNNAITAGGFYFWSTQTHISNSYVVNNTAINNGGGFFLYDAQNINLSNTVIANNTAANGGGILATGTSSLNMLNVTMNGNTATTNGSAINAGGSTTFAIKNSIVWSADAAKNIYNTATVNATYSNIQQSSGVYTGTNNINANPQFSNASDIDGADNLLFTNDDGLKLQAASTSLNVGDNAGVLDTDIAGSQRIFNTTVDLGAYEYGCNDYSNILYVNAAIATSGDGSSFSTAFKTLKEAVDAAMSCSNVTEIRVATGTYYPSGSQATVNRAATFAITRGGIKIIGGYNAATGLRSQSGNLTTLNGDLGSQGNYADNSFHIMVIAGIAAIADSIVVDGFVFRNASGNIAAQTSMTVNGVSIRSIDGAGIATKSNNNNTKISIRNCVFQNNYADGYGGAICNQINSSPRFMNCVFTNNVSSAGGAVFNEGSSPVFTNCTLSENSGVGAIYNFSNGNPVFYNSVIWNTSNAAIMTNNSSSPSFTNTILKGHMGNDPLFVNTTDPDGADNIWNTADDGLQLQANSSAINAGNNTRIPTGINTDILGNVRIQSSTVDMGAYEFNPCSVYANTLYVNASVTSSGSGHSWATAFKTFKEALDASNICNNVIEIRVAAGTYYPTGVQNSTNREATFAITRNGLKIYGGYSNTGNGTRNITANTTILSGDIGTANSNTDNSYHVMVLAGIPNSTTDSLIIEGFTIKDGNANGSGNATINGQSINRLYGGGIYSIIISANIEISQCSIANNIASNYGGGIYNHSSSPLITSCIINGNTADYGGGMYNYSSSPFLASCIISGNLADYGGGMFNDLSSPFITNCTISGNAADYSGGAMYNSLSSSNPSIRNSIILGNNTGIGNYNSTPTYSHSLVQDITLTSNGNISSAGITAEVVFANPIAPSGAPTTAGDYSLQTGSPVIDKGDNSVVTTLTDLAGNARIQLGVVDLGAYEFNPCSIISGTIYVDSSIAASGCGKTWNTAYKTLSEALTFANANTYINSILVAAGTYYPTGIQNSTDRQATFAITRNKLKIYGGYIAATGIRNPAVNSTILSGDIYDGTGTNDSTDNSYHVMVIAGVTTSATDSLVVDGFIIEKGNANISSTVTVNGSLVLNDYGGGIFARGNAGLATALAIRNCNVRMNTSTYGAGIYVNACSPSLINCVIANNVSATTGGGMYNHSGAQPSVVNCVFTENKSNNGGGVYNNAASPAFINTVFSKNGASFGAGMNNNFSSSPSLINCVFNGNAATTQGAGLRNNSSSAPSLVNCIVWGNTAPSNRSIYNTNSTPSVSYSNIEDSYNGTANINADPLFVNENNAAGTDGIWGTADDGLRLQNCSPSINKGLQHAAIPATDIAGNARIQMGKPDMGAYETVSDANNSNVSSVNNTGNNTQSSSSSTTYADNCNAIIAIVSGDGTANTISGNTLVKVWIETTPPASWVKRHYEITPDANAATATGRITLYFTQAEFDEFNTNNAVKLPEDATDNTGQANLKIEKRSGTSGDGSGLPGSYTGSIETIDPADNDIVWNAAANRWEVSFDVTGFSGFFVKTDNAVLPLKLLSFEGKRTNDINNLIWKTANESNLTNYEVQRSTNAREFTTIATVKANNGLAQSYTFDDKIEFTGKLYYRIKLNENDGKVSYSKIVTLTDNNQPSTINIFPNPARNIITIKMTDDSLQNTEIVVLNAQGRVVLKQKIQSTNQPLNISTLPQGIYFVKFANGEVQKLIKE